MRGITLGVHSQSYIVSGGAAVTSQYFEAEAGTNMGSGWTIASDAAASGGQYIYSNLATSTSAPATTDANRRVDYTASYEAGTYTLWFRGRKNGSNDSIYLGVNEGSTNFIALLTTAESGFVWFNTRSNGSILTFEFLEGQNTLNMYTRETGFSIDRIYITKNGDTPT